MRAIGVMPVTALFAAAGGAAALAAQARERDSTPTRTTCAIVVLDAPPPLDRMDHPPPTGVGASMPILEPGCVPSHVIEASRSRRGAEASGPLTPRLPLASVFSVPLPVPGQALTNPLGKALADAGRLEAIGGSAARDAVRRR